MPAPGALLADKAYDANNLRDSLSRSGTVAVIPPKRHRVAPPSFDRAAYRARNLIERAFCRLKDWRGIATRYDKTARNYLAGVSLAVAIMFWIR